MDKIFKKLSHRPHNIVAEKPQTPSSAPEHGTAVTDMFEVNIERIRVDQDQVRQCGKEVDSQEMQELAASIADQGLIQYPEVRWIAEEDVYEVVTGERRFVACSQILKWQRLPVRVTNISDPLELWKRQYAENAQRMAVDPIDLASSLAAIMQEHGLNQEQMAKMINKSRTYVQKAMSIKSQLSEEAKTILYGTSAAESLATVYEIATVPIEEQAEIAQQIVDQGLKQREVVKLTGEVKQRSNSSKRRGRPRVTNQESSERTIKLDNGVIISVKFPTPKFDDFELIASLKMGVKSVQKNRDPRCSDAWLRWSQSTPLEC